MAEAPKKTSKRKGKGPVEPIDRPKRKKIERKVFLPTVTTDSVWSYKDKEKLIEALHRYSPSAVESIANVIGKKTPKQVEEMITRMGKSACFGRNDRRVELDPEKGAAPLELWLSLVHELVKADKKTDYSASYSKVLDVIARNEALPEDSGFPNLSWSNLYRYIGDLLDDKAVPQTLTHMESLVMLDMMHNLGDTLHTSDTREQRKLLDLKYQLYRRQAETMDGVFTSGLKAFHNDFKDVKYTTTSEGAEQSTAATTLSSSSTTTTSETSVTLVSTPSTSSFVLHQPSTSSEIGVSDIATIDTTTTAPPAFCSSNAATTLTTTITLMAGDSTSTSTTSTMPSSSSSYADVGLNMAARSSWPSDDGGPSSTTKEGVVFASTPNNGTLPSPQISSKFRQVSEFENTTASTTNEQIQNSSSDSASVSLPSTSHHTMDPPPPPKASTSDSGGVGAAKHDIAGPSSVCQDGDNDNDNAKDDGRFSLPEFYSLNPLTIPTHLLSFKPKKITIDENIPVIIDIKK